MFTTTLNIAFHFDYFPLLVTAGLAWVIPMFLSIARIKKVPTVIIEIILGYFIGAYLLGSPENESYRILEFLALTGFLFLMFMSGLETDVDQIITSFPRKKITWTRFIKNPLLVGLTSFAITLILSYIGALSLSPLTNIQNHWYFALIMVTTSVGIILPVLKNRGETAGRYGQMLIIAAAVADILSIILFTFTAFIIKNGFKVEILLILALFITFYVFHQLGNKFVKVRFVKKIGFQLAHAASQLSFRGTIFLLLIFVVLAQYIGEEVILLGAFLSGLLLSSFLHKERSLLMVKLDGMGFGFFIPIFFIMVGAKFDPKAFMEFDQSFLLFFFLLLIILFAIKIIPSFLWARLFGYKKAIAGGFLMSSRLSLIIAASAIGLKMEIISPGINACFIIMAVVTCFLSPVMYNFLNPGDPLSGEKTIIIGGSSTAVLLARRLNVHGKTTIIIEKDNTRFKEIQQKGINAILGDALDVDLYTKVKLSPYDYVVVETAMPELNIKICRLLKTELRHDRIISRAGNSAVEKAFKRLEVETVDATNIIATTIENLIVRPSTYHALVESFENFSVEEFKITNKDIDSLQVKEIPFHKDAILMMVKRGNNNYIPHGDTFFWLGDIIHVFGTDSALEDTRSKLS